MAFEAMMELAKVCVIWWANATLDLAMMGGCSEAIKRHIDVVNGIGAAKEVYDEIAHLMQRTNGILGDRLAERCLILAKELQVNDARSVEMSSDAQPQSAQRAAQAINDEIRRAADLGAPQRHEAMLAAKAIAVALEIEEKIRYGFRAFLGCQKIQRRDNEEALVYTKSNGLPPVGPATVYADKCDREIKEACKLGAPPSHAHIVSAIKVSKDLRDQDGIRKREAARAARVAAEQGQPVDLGDLAGAT